MTTAATAVNSVETTTAMLQAELPQLEKHQQALQEELAAVSVRLESVRGALTALSALSATAIPHPRAAETDASADTEVAAVPNEPAAIEESPAPEPATGDIAAADEPAPAPQETAPARKARKTSTSTSTSTTKKSAAKSTDKPAKRRPVAKPTPVKAAKKTKQSPSTTASDTAQDTGGLTEQVIAILSRQTDVPLRARDVAEALGRDESTGSINAVRSTLDRLVATSRAHRAGRGLYQAPAA
ncbi:hypothetical protein ACIQMR_36330 [Streptomyces sp. NPDC091376]|uniref:hypothetical protein n=1 Tax=Streptomyces sp. NPDC091376 TaxID=3365994 RepID=UPI00382091A2